METVAYECSFCQKVIEKEDRGELYDGHCRLAGRKVPFLRIHKDLIGTLSPGEAAEIDREVKELLAETRKRRREARRARRAALQERLTAGKPKGALKTARGGTR